MVYLSLIHIYARRLQIDLQMPEEEILRLLERDREYFEPVKEPCFVHWDLWAGNVFVENGRITGLIDFERCLWADPLMEVGFRTYGLFPPFLEGYGRKSLTKEEFRRAEWYDVYLFLIACLECDYRQYDTRDTYIWGTGMLRKWIQELKEPEAIERGMRIRLQEYMLYSAEKGAIGRQRKRCKFLIDVR